MHTPEAAGRNLGGRCPPPLPGTPCENAPGAVRWDRWRPPTGGRGRSRTRQPPLRALVRDPGHPLHEACVPFAGADCPHAAPTSRGFLDSRAAPPQPPERASERGQRERRRGPGRAAVVKARARALEQGGRRGGGSGGARGGGSGGGGEGSPREQERGLGAAEQSES